MLPISSPAVGFSSFYLVAGFELVLIETLHALVLLTILIVFLTSVGSLLISALMVGATIVAVHDAFRVLEDLFLAFRSSPWPAALTMAFYLFLKGAHISSSLHMTIQTMIADLTDLPNAPCLLSSLVPSIFPANSTACHPTAAAPPLPGLSRSTGPL